jgi:hypothetical protein
MAPNHDPVIARQQLKSLAVRSKGRLRVVDEESAYFRLHASEMDAQGFYDCLRNLLRAEE